MNLLNYIQNFLKSKDSSEWKVKGKQKEKRKGEQIKAIGITGESFLTFKFSSSTVVVCIALHCVLSR